MTQSGTGSDDFERLARQYWSQWGEMLRAAAPAQAPSQTPGWQAPGSQATGWNQAIDWWSQLARGGSGHASGANDAIERFNAQARGWLGQMQQVASQFAGRDASAADIAQAWQQALGGSAGNPFAQMMRGMGGSGQHGVEDWFQQAMPFLQGLQKQWQGGGGDWTDMPAFGFAREHQQRLQRLLQAQRDAQQHSQAYYALMAEAGQDAFARFEQKLAERGEPGRQITSARALLDLWIDAAEEAYAEVALSPRFRDAYAAMVNAQMGLRARVQDEIEQVGQLLGVPTRTEVDATHRKIVQLERELRRLRDALQGMDVEAAASTPRPQAAKRGSTGKAATKKAAKKSTTRKSAARKSASVKSASRKTTSKKAPRKTPTRKAASKQSGASRPARMTGKRSKPAAPAKRKR